MRNCRMSCDKKQEIVASPPLYLKQLSSCDAEGFQSVKETSQEMQHLEPDGTRVTQELPHGINLVGERSMKHKSLSGLTM